MTIRRLPAGSANVLWRWTSCTPGAPAQARTALRCALDLLGYDGETVSDAVLAVSELVANATEHAPGPYELRLRRADGALLCEVEDQDPRIPKIPEFPAVLPFAPAAEHRGGGLAVLCSLLSERGRGLHIVHELSGGAWGFRSRRKTKVAWVALPVPCGPDGSAQPPHPRTGELWVQKERTDVALREPR
ncbi:ATP-binding protein [Actinacidiphila sp. bgisy167]|uniref:ATP-binding protein n=1 Tax=Actinacidiphila sp. bgisy167 TaxID=3413797 RepID=UPI003D74968F